MPGPSGMLMQMTVRDTAKVQEALGSVDFQSR